jgi:hypothetical protein
MLISKKQQEANRRNALQSTGPRTPEGKAGIRFNALTFGLRTRSTVLPAENAQDYYRLWDELEAEWQPQTRTERCHLETMATSQWLLARVAESETRVYAFLDFGERQFVMLGYVAKQRAQLERSFRTAIADLKQLQKERQAGPQPQPAQAAQSGQTAKPAPAPAPPPTQPEVPPPAYLVSQMQMMDADPAFRLPVTPDTR